MTEPIAIVLSGGGARGFAEIGMLEVLEDHGLLDAVDVVVGTSAGAVVAAALARGYTAAQIWDIWSRDVWDNASPDDPKPLSRILDINFEGLRAGLLDDWRDLTGLVRGDKLLAIFHRYLDEQSPDRRIEPAGPPRRLYVIAVDVEDGREMVFHFCRHVPSAAGYTPAPGREAYYCVYDDARDGPYNAESPITFADAVRASVSLPVTIVPYPLAFRRQDPATGEVEDIQATLVDGGARDGFPLGVAVKLARRRSLLGMYLGSTRYLESPVDGGLPELVQRVLTAMTGTVFEADQDDAEIRTANVRVLVPNLPPTSGDFDLRAMDAIHTAGRQVTLEFLAKVWYHHGRISWDTIFAPPDPSKSWLRPPSGRAGLVEPEHTPGGEPCPPPPENYYLYVPDAPPEPVPVPAPRPPSNGQRVLVAAGAVTLFLALLGLVWLIMALVERRWLDLGVGAVAAALLAAAIVTGAWGWLKRRIEQSIGE